MPKPTKGPTHPALVMTHGAAGEKTFFLNKNAITIGKARECDIVLEAGDVSPVHCIICRSSGFYEIRNSGGRPGTQVNGDDVAEATIHHGDTLQIDHYKFEVHLPDKKSGNGVERKLKHFDHSRRNFAKLALHLREKARNGGPKNNGDLKAKASGLRARVKDFELRQAQLQQGERELARGRDLLDKERRDFKINVAEVEKQLAHWEEKLAKQKAEVEQQQSQPNNEAAEAWIREQTEALRDQQEAVQLAEDTIRQQRGELTRMIGELREIQDAIRSQQGADVTGLQEENQLLRQRLEEQQYAQHVSAEPAPEFIEEFEQLRKENSSLRQLVEERDSVIEELKQTPAPTAEPAEDKDLDSYEAELNRFRQQLEADRKKLVAELEQVKMRNEELDEATREMEMEMSRERAELARERTRLDRMREDVKADTERQQRDASVMQTLAPVQKLRQDINGAKKAQGEQLDERLRSVSRLRNG